MIKTRFSPSPSGLLHLGNVRAALFSALYAKKTKGIFLLRIEDTDATRTEQKFIDILQEDLHWLGLDWQEGPFYQSQRHAIYDEFFAKLEQENLAYPCFCTDEELAFNRKIQLSRGQAPRYPGTCQKLSADEVRQRLESGKKPTLRFRVPENQAIEFVDLVKGPQKFMSSDIGDFIVRRADRSATFLFCNAIDDSLMNVTHVLRGDDHLANTPRQLMLLNAFKMRKPEYGHLSLITGDDGSKLSKRHGSFSLVDVKTTGYLSIAVMNYLARLSHAYDEPRLLSFEELAERFFLEKLSHAPARFDQNQLLHWQKEAVMQSTHDALWEWIGDEIKQSVPEASRETFIEMMRQNILFPTEAKKWAEILFGGDLVWNDENKVLIKEAGAEFFATALNAAKLHPSDLKMILNDLKTQSNTSGKKLFMPVRLALTGEQHGPELAQIATLLGPAKIQERFAKAVQFCEA